MQFLTYMIVGCIATLAHYSLLLFLVEIFFVPPWVASIYGGMFGSLIGYAGNRGYTFSQTTNTQFISFPRYIIIAICGALLNGLLVWFGTSTLNLHYLISQILATLIIFILTFQLNRTWTFM